MKDVNCTHCGFQIGRMVDGRLKIKVRSRLVAVTSSGAEVNCPQCKRVTGLPLVYAEFKEANGRAPA